MTAAPAPTARIQRIEVVGLFGLYDHVIDLKLADHVTILHGPNGVGKTTLLKLVHAFVTRDFAAMLRAPFRELHVHTTSGIHWTARTALREVRRRNQTGLHLTLQLTAMRDGIPVAEPSTLVYSDVPDRSTALVTALRALSPSARQLQLPVASEWWFQNQQESTVTPLIDLLAELEVRMISADRLLRPREANNSEEQSEPSRSAIWQHTAALKQRIAADWVRYGEVSQDLDRTYPTRLLSGPPGDFTVDALKVRMIEIEAKRSALRNIGLLDEQVAPFDPESLDKLPSSQLGVMALYVRDTEQKLGTLDALARRLTVLLRIVNARFRNKSVRADPEHGLAVTSHDGRPLTFDALSSGEQHQIILLLDLLFHVPLGALVLLDEPELSLHVLWQKRFLPDLLEIVEVAEIDALIATHSPFIVGDRSDLMVALDAEIDHDEPVQP